MEEDPKQGEESAAANGMAEESHDVERDPGSHSLNQPLLKRHRTLSSNPLAMVGTKVSKLESLDYE